MSAWHNGWACGDRTDTLAERDKALSAWHKGWARKAPPGGLITIVCTAPLQKKTMKYLLPY
mgnify:FL=1